MLHWFDSGGGGGGVGGGGGGGGNYCGRVWDEGNSTVGRRHKCTAPPLFGASLLQWFDSGGGGSGGGGGGSGGGSGGGYHKSNVVQERIVRRGAVVERSLQNVSIPQSRMQNVIFPKSIKVIGIQFFFCHNGHCVPFGCPLCI